MISVCMLSLTILHYWSMHQKLKLTSSFSQSPFSNFYQRQELKRLLQHLVLAGLTSPSAVFKSCQHLSCVLSRQSALFGSVLKICLFSAFYSGYFRLNQTTSQNRKLYKKSILSEALTFLLLFGCLCT